ncbi:AraC family transcriptional regulator [Planomonospora parontospora]|uniref:AraC family transcriptional regulator n=1 Tax=Planomonospora parontospora TaxID=58119 RepID=UPI001780900D|nr:helix-turn-helix domain-containing protein [Planomonospora parontospora]
MEEVVTTGGLTYAAAEPSPALQPYVRQLSAYSERYDTPLERRQPPFAGIVLIFGFGAPLGLDGPGGARRLASFTGGLHETYVDTVTTGAAEGVQVDLTPAGARRLLGIPLSELANRVIPLEEALGPWAGTAVERLAGAGDRHARLALLDGLLVRRIHTAPDPDPRVGWAWSRLVATGGAAGVAALARELGWSHRHLVARFRDQIGLTPKAAARVLRFEHALDRLRGGARPADTAAACGYYDQAHMNRDFRTMAGASPGELVRSWTAGRAIVPG